MMQIVNSQIARRAQSAEDSFGMDVAGSWRRSLEGKFMNIFIELIFSNNYALALVLRSDLGPLQIVTTS